MPNARIHNKQPNVGIQSRVPHIRVSSFQTGFLSAGTSGSTQITAGTPIGLLLALTYATDQGSAGTSETYRGDYRPNVRISNV